MKYYKSNPYSGIEEVDVEKETDNSVWIKGARSNKITNYECFFPSYDEARQHLINEQQKKIDRAKNQMIYQEGQMAELLKKINRI